MRFEINEQNVFYVLSGWFATPVEKLGNLPNNSENFNILSQIWKIRDLIKLNGNRHISKSFFFFTDKENLPRFCKFYFLEV